MAQVVRKITKTLFEQCKGELEHVSPQVVAMSNHLSVKTILQIKGSESFEDYEKNKMAQHPRSTKPPLGERISEMERKIDLIYDAIVRPKLL